MPLDNATLRFVEAIDGRGKGLGRIDLQVVNKAHILQQSQQRGCPVDGDQVMVLWKDGKLEGRLSPKGRLTSTKSTCGKIDQEKDDIFLAFSII